MLRPRLISPLSLAGLTLAVVIVLVLLHPKQRLAEQIKSDAKVDEISLQYIKNLLATDPDNEELRLQLAKAYVSIGQYENAFATLQPLYASTNTRWREEAMLVKLGILLNFAFAETHGSPERKLKMEQFLQELRANEVQFTDPGSLRQLARLAELGGELQVAERIVLRLILAGATLQDLDAAARIALANGRYLESAQYTWRSRQLASDAAQKIIYLKLALSTLESGRMGHIGLEWVQKLPEAEWQSAEVLFSITKLALASNRPVLAADFANRLIALDASSTGLLRFNSAHYELAYTAFLGISDLPSALILAQTAVRREPENIIWRERLANVAEWSNQPQLAMVHWRWLATHRNSDADWQAWMRLAAALFDYDAQVIGLERDWRLHGRSEKYARKIIQLYEYLGQPADALTWLDKNGDETRHPELLLLSAELLTNMGREADASIRYRRYLKRHVASPDLAVTIAALLQRAGLYQEALDVLLRSRPQAQPADKKFWLSLGEVAWILKRYDDAIVAFRILSDAPDAELNQQVRLFQAIKQNNARLAARTAEEYWLKNGRIELFMNAVETYAVLNDWQAVQRLYRLTDEPKWRDYDNNLRFVSIRAEMHKHFGNFAAAEHDYRLLASRYPGDLAVKESYLWLLIDTQKLNQLDVLMQRWTKLLPSSPNLWSAYAAGHQILGRPSQALILYDRMAKSHSNDELWLINYASTLEAGGQVKKATSIRAQIWQKRRNRPGNSNWLNTGANANDIEALRMLLLNDPALGQGILWKLLRDGSAELKQNSQFVELATVWLNDNGQNDASRAWLIRQYARKLNTSQ